MKTLNKLFRQDRERFVVPRSVQDVIPVRAIWEDGVFLVGNGAGAPTRLASWGGRYDLGRSMILSLDIIPIPTDEAVREVEKRVLGVETSITNWQRRQNANNNFSALISYDMELQRRESKLAVLAGIDGRLIVYIHVNGLDRLRRGLGGFLRGDVLFGDGRRCRRGRFAARLLLVGPDRAHQVGEVEFLKKPMTQRDVSYAAIDDLRREYKAGQHVGARLKKIDAGRWNIEVSVKEVNPNPFDGADARHPAGCVRQAFVTGRYGVGLFCKMTDDTSCLCLYSPGYYNENCDIGDKILVRITKYDYRNKLIYGKMLAKA